jgi:hypothetical protein
MSQDLSGAQWRFPTNVFHRRGETCSSRASDLLHPLVDRKAGRGAVALQPVTSQPVAGDDVVDLAVHLLPPARSDLSSCETHDGRTIRGGAVIRRPVTNLIRAFHALSLSGCREADFVGAPGANRRLGSPAVPWQSPVVGRGRVSISTNLDTGHSKPLKRIGHSDTPRRRRAPAPRPGPPSRVRTRCRRSAAGCLATGVKQVILMHPCIFHSRFSAQNQAKRNQTNPSRGQSDTDIVLSKVNVY